MDAERGAGAGERGQILALADRRRVLGPARQDDALRYARPGEGAPQGGGSGREGRNARHHCVGDGERVEPVHLLAHGRIEGDVAGLEPRHVLARRVRRREMVDDSIEIEALGIDASAPAQRQDVGAHERACVKADGARLYEPRGLHGQQIGGAGSCADEVDGHGPAL